jgi:replicative DNA helicase
MTEQFGANFQKYIPERDYKSRDYQPFDQPFDDMCKNCELYYELLFRKNLTKRPFMPVCKRHVLEEFKDLQVEDFESQEEFDEFQINIDPVAWSYSNFGWTARWYQEELMSCSAKKKIVRAGRRCGKTNAIVMLILWGIFTHSNWTILVIAPFDSQVGKIFDEFEKMLQLSPKLSSAIKRKRKNPHILELVNGSKVKGYSSGPQSASRSDKIRGEDANYIVLDEADYLADSDLEAIIAILASHPDCGLWASSTPKGTHNKFYQWATDKNLGFKEFHFISQEAPSWTQEAEDFFSANYDKIAYEHEFLAEFGLQEAGVFRNDLIDLSISPYEMPLPRSSPQSRIVMGVDWNGEKAGVHIVVTEFWNGKYKVLAKEVVKDANFTQHAAVEKIVATDAIYGCDFIYVDEGYGRVQVEMLHKLGMQNPGTGLHRRVVPYAYNKPIEIKDPRSGEVVKKPAKPFLVQTTALQLEQGRLILPASEDTTILVKSKEGEAGNKQPGLVQQMRNFAVERVSTLGLPTYTSGDDHTMFAFMLSIAGFLLEFSDLRRTNISMGFTHTNVGIGGKVEPKSPDQKNEQMASIVRQLDAGKNRSILKANASSGFSANKAIKSLRSAISRGDKTAIKRHFDSRNITRGQTLKREGKRDSF